MSTGWPTVGPREKGSYTARHPPMFLYPIGRDDARIRRHAWVSYVIIALNIVVFIVSHAAMMARDVAPLEAKWNEIVEHLSQHPYLIPGEGLRPMLAPDDLKYLEQAREDWYRNRGGWEPAARRGERANQRILDDLTAELVSALRETPFHRWGYIPADGSLGTMLTAMFLHGDLGHLIGNLMFFFATAPFIEDVFGRPLFTALYFSGGIAATIAHAATTAVSEAPLIGASGAIAAVMGAYLVRFATSRIEFIWLPIIFLPRMNVRFFVPAFIVLPMWFALQFYFATRESLLSGVAFWAHVGGFAYGAVFCLLIRVTDVEKRVIDPSIEGKITWRQDPHLLRAAEARAAGDYAGAQREIAAMLKKEPGNLDAHRAGYETAVEGSDAALLGRYAASLLDVLIRGGELDLAREHIDEALSHDAAALPDRFYLRAAQFIEKQGDRRRAAELYEAAVRYHSSEAGAFRAMIQLARLHRLSGDPDAARLSIRSAQSHPACSPEERRHLDAQLDELPPEPMPWG